MLHGALFNACVMDVESSNVQWIWMIEKLRRRAPQCVIIVYCGTKGWEWEEEAYLMGVAHVLTKPVRARVLNSLLERTLDKPPPAPRPDPVRPGCQPAG